MLTAISQAIVHPITALLASRYVVATAWLADSASEAFFQKHGRSLFITGGLLAGLLLLLAIIIYFVKRKLNAWDAEGSAAFTLVQLRDLYRDGQLTEEEYERAKKKLAERELKTMLPDNDPPRKSAPLSQTESNRDLSAMSSAKPSTTSSAKPPVPPPITGAQALEDADNSPTSPKHSADPTTPPPLPESKNLDSDAPPTQDFPDQSPDETR